MSGFRGICAGVVHALLFYTLYNPFYFYEIGELGLVLIVVAVVRCLILQQDSLKGFRTSLIFSWICFPVILVLAYGDVLILSLLRPYFYLHQALYIGGLAGTLLALVVSVVRQRGAATQKSDPRAPEL